MDDTGNAILLQASLYIAFDRLWFVFVPKPLGDDSEMRLVLYLLEPLAEFEHLYYNRKLHPLDVGVEMLFARFAWTLFLLLEAFLSCKEDRRLTVRTTSHDQILDCGYFSATACERFSISLSRKRSVSPKKRKPDEGAIDSYGVVDVDIRKHIQPLDNTNRSASALNFWKRLIGCIDYEPPTPCRTPRSNKRRKASPVSEQSSFSSTVSLTSLIECSTYSGDDAEGLCMIVFYDSPLAQKWLEKERERSDPKHTWTEEVH
jgi:hypothetical protein